MCTAGGSCFFAFQGHDLHSSESTMNWNGSSLMFEDSVGYSAPVDA